jgi:spore coat polysaccharide biosynthesis protein SpsF (cytidylyltransferase family)
LIDEGIVVHVNEQSEYTSNVVPPTFPDGFDFEIFSKEVLETAHYKAKSAHYREHVTPWIIEHTKSAQSNIFFKDQGVSHANKRVTLDNEDDLSLLKTLVENYNISLESTVCEVISILDYYPELQKINQKHDVRKNEK